MEDLLATEEVQDVFDEKYKHFIEQTQEELGLSNEEEPNLAYHPERADYITISQLRTERIKQNQKAAKLILRDEESYAFRNIYERATFLIHRTH